MASKNQVTLTFAGDTDKLEKAFDRVGGAAKEMSSDVGGASRSIGDVGQAGAGFDSVGERADVAEQRILGVKDSVDGVAVVMQGPGEQGITAYIQGWADIASGLVNFLIPAAKVLFTTGAQTVANHAAAASQAVARGATVAWTGAQWALNVALSANPIGLVILAIAALGAGLVLAWRRSETFRDVVTGAFQSARRIAGNVVDWFTRVPGLIRTAFSGLFTILTWPYRTAFNFIARAWNNTVGQLRWTVPWWVPGIGGNSVGAPRLPTFHQGGIASGAMGGQFLAMLRAGEQVSPTGGAPTASIAMTGGGTALEQLLAEFIHLAVRTGLIQLNVDGQPVAVAGG